jgi:hypothetical protein
MTYIEELSEYTYAHSAYYRPITKAVGWLARDHTFWSFQPTDELLDLIWQYCKFPVARMRGSHDCEFCSTNLSTARDLPSLLAGLKEARHHRRVERNGETMMLGSAEMRVFGKNGLVYAAPNLIYHYVSVHHYEPPSEFLEALRSDPRPPDPSYRSLLEKLDLA